MLAYISLLAMAAPQNGAEGGNWMQMLMPMVLIFGIFYFLLIRPQQKQQKKHKDMLSNLKKGDDVVTRGGLYGKVHSVADQVITVELSKDFRVKIAREAVAGLRTEAAK